MSEIMFINGKVKHMITLDPAVWIFDDRKIELEDFFLEPSISEKDAILNGSNENDPYPDIKKKRYKKSQWLTDSFVMPVRPFIENAEPLPDAKTIIFELSDGKQVEYVLDDVLKGAFAFSKDGKALKDDGPVHFYMHDGSNKQEPLKAIKKITLA